MKMISLGSLGQETFGGYVVIPPEWVGAFERDEGR
jgi:hypothetical protein